MVEFCIANRGMFVGTRVSPGACPVLRYRALQGVLWAVRYFRFYVLSVEYESYLHGYGTEKVLLTDSLSRCFCVRVCLYRRVSIRAVNALRQVSYADFQVNSLYQGHPADHEGRSSKGVRVASGF